MKHTTCSIDHLIDQVDISEFERQKIKSQVHQAEQVADAIQACISKLGRLAKSMSPSRSVKLHQH